MGDQRVLIVEDDNVTRMMLEARLRAAAFTATSAPGGEAALALLETTRFALMVTDLHMEAVSGIELMRRARTVDPDLEIIVLTGAATLESAIAAVNHSAHAYLRKPVAPGELEAAAAAALAEHRTRQSRRTALRHLGAELLRIAEPEISYTHSLCDDVLRLGPLELNVRRRRTSVRDRVVELSSSEFDLLLYMAQRDRQVVSAEELAREVLNYGSCTSSEARELVKARIHRLRRKIERDPAAPALLLSVRGAGYTLTAGE